MTNKHIQGQIRPYDPKDDIAILSILKAPGGHYYDKENLDLSDFQENYVYETSEGTILGFVCLEVHEKISQIICYVAPTHRRQGIGEQLYEYGKECLSKLDPNTTWLFFRCDVGDSASFYQNRGAKPWYAYHYMVYEGTPEAKASYGFDNVTLYEEQNFESYLENRAAAFLSVNQLIDSRPHDERERRDEILKWTTTNKENIWLFWKDQKLAGSVTLYDGFFDELFVSPDFKGKGVGKDIVHWALNRVIKQGHNPCLCVVTNNVPASNLYQSVGFNVAQTLEMNRIFSTNKEPDLRGPIGG